MAMKLPIVWTGRRMAALMSAALALVLNQGSVEEGRDLLRQEKYEEARKAFESVLATDATSREAQVGLGRALLGLGEVEKAEDVLKKVLTQSPNDAEATVHLGRAALLRGDRFREKAGGGDESLALSAYQDAARWFTESTAAEPNNVDSWNDLGLVKTRLEEFKGAAQAYERSLAIVPGDVTANFRLGELYSRYHAEPEKAVPYLQTVLRAVPDHVDARRYLAQTLLALGRATDAIAEYRRVLKAKPDDRETWAALWNLHATKGKYDEARRLYRSILDEDPKNATAQFHLGFCWFYEKKFPEAIDAMQKVLELDAKHDSAERVLGDCYLALGDLPNATTHYLTCVQLNPENPDAFNGLAGVAQELSRQKRYDEAVDLFTKALASKPSEPLLHANLALTLKDMGRFDEAIRSYERAIELGPADSATWNDLGLLYEGKRQFDKASDCYRKAESIDGNVDATENLGVLLLKFGNYEKAMAEFRKVLEKDAQRDRASVLYTECRRLIVERTSLK